MERTVVGECVALFAFDAGFAIDLDRAQSLVGRRTQRETMRHGRPTPEAFEYRPAPLRIVEVTGSSPRAGASGSSTVPAAPVVAGRACDERIECLLFDFGAASVAYRFPINDPLAKLLDFSEALYENKALADDARRRVEGLLALIRPAVEKPGLAPFLEDYVIFRLDPPDDIDRLLDEERALLARVLRSERGQLSTDEQADAMACRIAYTQGEAALIDWNAAILFQNRAEDAMAVLEYTNVELLEMRTLDDQLDAVLERAYHMLTRRRWLSLFALASGRQMRRLARLQMDGAILFEGVNNAVKLLGDQYLARLYRLAAHRLHLPEWDASILRKLQTLDGIYQKLADQSSTRRMELLEWIIILLIAFEIGMSLWGG
ncbi:MAG: hypothetical protein ACKVW3_05710 [Phycisphaerales bacterium]